MASADELAAAARDFAIEGADAGSRWAQVDYLMTMARYRPEDIRAAMVALVDDGEAGYQGGLMLLFDAYELVRRRDAPPQDAPSPERRGQQR